MSGHAIHIKLDGRTYSGTYQGERKILTPTSGARNPGSSTPAGVGPAGKVAQGLNPLGVPDPGKL
jgi:hypothetical protein